MNTYRIASACLVAVASFTFSGCGCDRQLAYKDVEIQELQRVNKELEDQLDACEQKKITTVYHDNPNVTPEQAIGDGVAISHRPMETVFTIENSVLFRPGSADLSANAKATLSKVIATINEKYKGYYVRVDGHTDDQKISRSKDKWDDNWDLSGGRGQKVLHYLLDHGIPASNLGFAGYADQRPVGANSSEASRAKNRRVEIVVIPKTK